MERIDRRPATASLSQKLFLLKITEGMAVAMSSTVLLISPTVGVTTSESVIDPKIADA
jgi:hypothetical protein